ncbi:MAG: hypothetical protein EOO06_00975 [Chitinophagaceae bacterium]|nr:MAG: hypothetical protein EOO06_00975 [Chitinophagaceae bacterium]
MTDEGRKLLSELMMVTGGDPLEWKDRYDNLVKFIEQLENRTVSYERACLENKALHHEKDRLQGKLKYFQNKLMETTKIEITFI